QALVNVTNLEVLNKYGPFLDPLRFQVTFECIEALQEGEHPSCIKKNCHELICSFLNTLAWFPSDLEWKVIYVGSAENSEHDQVLEEVLVGPVPVGVNKFVLEADGPDPKKIPEASYPCLADCTREDLRGVTVLLVTCSYRDREFIRVGYYVNNDLPEAALVKKEPPPEPSKMVRMILADKPRVTRFPIDWGANAA
ncbi:unnamed protein product, partial [Chrysoparadoxa australica]